MRTRKLKLRKLKATIYYFCYDKQMKIYDSNDEYLEYLPYENWFTIQLHKFRMKRCKDIHSFLDYIGIRRYDYGSLKDILDMENEKRLNNGEKELTAMEFLDTDPYINRVGDTYIHLEEYYY